MNHSDHEYFEQLCALAPMGRLSAGELGRLNDHLNGCDACRKSLSEYEQLCTAFLGDQQAARSDLDNSVHDRRRKAVARNRLMAAIRSDGIDKEARMRRSPAVGLSALIAWPIPVALSVSLVAALTWGWWEHRMRVAAVQPSHQPTSLTKSVTDDAAALEWRAKMKQVADALQATRSQSRLAEEAARRDVSQWAKQEAVLRAQLAEIERRSSVLTDELNDVRSSNAALSAANQKLANSLGAADGTLIEARAEIARLAGLRDHDGKATAALEGQIRQLQDHLGEQSEVVRRGEQLLQTDRDIRDLMGARNLHVVDVFDVDTRGKFRAPFGRVFYIEGKSLVFYAFDLTMQKGVRPASAFQAWGQNDQGASSSLGILYTDNVNQNRWMLRFDNPKVLAELQAVYVTVEPPGGSKQPSGRKLLVANLATWPNHP